MSESNQELLRNHGRSSSRSTQSRRGRRSCSCSAAKEGMTGCSRVLSNNNDFIKELNLEVFAENLEVCAENLEAVDKKNLEVCAANCAESFGVCIENFDVNSETVKELCLLEQGESRCQDGDLTVVWSIAKKQTRLPMMTWLEGKGKTLAIWQHL
eukprot:5111116-Amphidinium_carterae.5